MISSRTSGILSGLAATSIWGGMYVVSKVVLEVIPPFALVTLRLLLGVATMWIFIARDGGLKLPFRQIIRIMAAGLVGYGISLGFQFVGTKLSNASNGALVTSTTPAFVLFFAALILRERITWRKLAALILSSLGVLAVIDPGQADLSSHFFWGNLSLVAAALTWALYSVLVRKITRNVDVLRATMVFFWGGFFITVPAAVLESQTTEIGTITLAVVVGVLYLGIVSTALAMFLWNKAFTLLDAGTASLTFFAQPVVGAGLGALFLGEQITPLFLVGGVLIGSGIWLAARETRAD